MGIGYDDSIILYNAHESGTLGKQLYFGTRFDNVRIELTQGANIRRSGLENADACVVKIPNDGNLPKPYMSPEVWNGQTTEVMEKNFTIDTANSNFFVIVKKKGLGIDLELPEGMIESSSYKAGGISGYLNYCKINYGHVYVVNTLDTYDLIPRFEIGGR